MAMDESRIADLLHFYETLAPDRLQDFGHYYSKNAHFKDPFNEVNRLDDIRAIFARMFRQVLEPQFVIKERVGDGCGLFLVWDMRYRMRSWKSREVQIIRGVSHLRFDEDGKVSYHRDYWDTGEELYAKLPLIGSAVRLLKRAVA